MSDSEQLTLYTNKHCPFAHRVELALAEAGATYTKYSIDLQNKPDWYVPKVNPVGKVPAIAYGGPKVPADQPSPESHKLIESLVLVEFVVDIYPNANLLPADPVLRAKARIFIDALSNTFTPAFFAWVRGGPSEGLLAAYDTLQLLLPPEQKWAVGDQFSIADVAAAPFFARQDVILKNGLRSLFIDDDARERFKEKYARIHKYAGDLLARDTVQATFDEEHVTEFWTKRIAELKKT